MTVNRLLIIFRNDRKIR